MPTACNVKKASGPLKGLLLLVSSGNEVKLAEAWIAPDRKNAVISFTARAGAERGESLS
jgi:hypothetical protein